MKLKLTNVRLSFPALFQAEAFKQGDVKKFKATFLIPKDHPQIKEIEQAAIAALNVKFPGKGELVRKQIAGNNNKCCIQDGDASEYAGYDGCIAVAAKNTIRPLVLDCAADPNTGKPRIIYDETEGRPYAGCYVDASIEFFGYDQQGKGLSASLRGVQFRKDGDAFTAGSVASEDEFDDLSAAGEEDPLM